jgi:cobalamin biosynthesis Mg chelatase CobN
MSDEAEERAPDGDEEKSAKPSGSTAKPSGSTAKPSGSTAKPSAADAKASEGASAEPRTAVLREPELPAAGTAEGDTLRRGLMLYEVGNYREMRAILTPLTSAKDPAVADAASALLKRIAVDPVQIGFLVGCLLAILSIAFHYLGH